MVYFHVIVTRVLDLTVYYLIIVFLYKIYYWLSSLIYFLSVQNHFPL